MKVFLCQGFNSWNNKQWYLLADSYKQAEQAITGLTDGKILMFDGKTKLEAATEALRAVTNS